MFEPGQIFFYSKGNYSVSKICLPVVCLLMFGRLSCLFTDFCWDISDFYCN